MRAFVLAAGLWMLALPLWADARSTVLVDVLRGPDRQRERHERHEAVQPDPEQHGERPQRVEVVPPFFPGKIGRLCLQRLLHGRDEFHLVPTEH